MTDHDFLVEGILAEHSKTQTMRLAHWIGTNPVRFETLMTIFLGNTYRLTQRSAWILRYVGEYNPVLLTPWWSQLIAMLRRTDAHPAVRRNILNVLEVSSVPEMIQDDLADCCFQYLADPQEAVAVRAAAITILDKICQSIPELRPELHLLLEEQLEHGTAALKSRARKVLGGR